MASLFLSQDPANNLAEHVIIKNVIGSLDPSKPLHVLELGAYEGLTSSWIAEFLLGDHPDSTLLCVDMWEPAVYYENLTAFEVAGSAHATVLAALSTGEAATRFVNNVARAPFGARVRAARTSTVAGLSTLIANLGGQMGRRELYDLIYG